MELLASDVLDVLKQNTTSLFHANSVKTSHSFLCERALISRERIEKLGLPQSPQKSDETDKQLGIWNDLFLDAVDIHNRSRSRNLYGPVLFEFSIDLLVDIDFVWITKTNPCYWISNGLSRDYFSSVEEFKTNYNYGDFQKMLTIKCAEGIIPFSSHLKKIILDDPCIKNGSDFFLEAYEILTETIHKNGLDIVIEKRKCPNKNCRCQKDYNYMEYEELKLFFDL